MQYVVSFNPPLMLTNLAFSPLEVIEIKNPCTSICQLITQAKIPPKMSEHFGTLDASEQNTSWIRFVFYDLKNDLMLSSTIDKFFKSEHNFFSNVDSD